MPIIIETKYQIGDTVWSGRASSVREVLPCPDCLGTREWKAVTPAGEEFSFACPRCDLYFSKLPTLETVNWQPTVRSLTIGSVRVNTEDRDTDPISYMCRETGVGSGTVWYQHDLFPSEAEALRKAETDCVAERLNFKVRPDVRKRDTISSHAFTNAHIKQAEGRVRDYKFKLQDVQKAAFDDLLSDEDARTQIKALLETVDG